MTFTDSPKPASPDRPPGSADALQAAARVLGVPLDAAVADRLLRYLAAVLVENQSHNLTAITGFEEGIERHLLDSLAIALHLAVSPPGSGHLIDLGTGGGFPGVVLATLVGDRPVHLVEAREKKLGCVRRAASAAGIRNLAFHHGRLSELRRRMPSLARSAALIVARAVGALDLVVQEAAPVLARGASLVVWKADPLPDAERKAGDEAARATGLRGLDDLPYRSFKPCRLVRYVAGD